MASIRGLCSRVVVLDNGCISFDGDVNEGISEYLSQKSKVGNILLNENNTYQNENISLRKVIFQAENKEIGDLIYIEDEIDISIEFFNWNKTNAVDITLHFMDQQETILFVTGSNTDENWHGKRFKSGIYNCALTLPGNLLNAGEYFVRVVFGHAQKELIYLAPEMASFEVQNSINNRGSNHSKAPGFFRPLIKWKTTHLKHEI